MSNVPDVATATEWDVTYRTLFAPAIRAAGFDAIRSKPTVGNLVKGIINDLWAADAVLADLTGQKANVFYELGVRHALRGKTLIIARDKKDIPFDLQSYAWHTYNPKTKRGRVAFRSVIQKLLQHILEHPDQPDNPVEDFLHNIKRIHGTLSLSQLTQPQRNACLKQMNWCEHVIDEISRGQVPISGGTAEYFAFFLDLIESGDGCESVRVFLSKMDDNSLRYDEAASKPLFAPFRRAVRQKKMRMEYTCLFESRQYYDKAKDSTMLDRHSQFAESVRKVFLDDLKGQPLQTDKTIVLLENLKWAITHTWSDRGIIENANLFTERSHFGYLSRLYRSIRSHSYSHA